MSKFRVIICVVILVIPGAFSLARAQLSPNTVSYSVARKGQSSLYTVWAHPNYETPNSFNERGNEFVYTAQVSLKVPKEFTISNITDIRGVWDKTPRKMGDPQIEKPLLTETYDSTVRYYSLGMSPGYDMGHFTKGDSVALFTFEGNTLAGQVEILANDDPFIQVSVNTLSLNVGCSFYSLSGQPSGVNSTPLEQFVARKPRHSLLQKPRGTYLQSSEEKK